jgi:hypothetical protein
LTILLKPDQTKNRDELDQQLVRNRFWAHFPPEGIPVESWYELMGFGQVVTLRVPAMRLQDVNQAIERSAWGVYRTEFYPSYDMKPAVGQLRAAALAPGSPPEPAPESTPAPDPATSPAPAPETPAPAPQDKKGD